MTRLAPRRGRASHGGPPAVLLGGAIAFLIAAASARAALTRPTPRPAPLAVAGPIGYLYINEGTSDRTATGAPNVVSGVAVYSDGSLALLPGSPWSTGGRGPLGPLFLASPRIGICASGGDLYAVDQGSDDVAAFAIGDDGNLTPLPGSPFPSGGRGPQSLAVTPDGRWLFVGHPGTGTIVSFALGP
ncbi:MAG TPA: beta-propeller fold lactonase family protein, partial [Candidatus Polarisedimenticolia bacterium]|nr:beta-propeller fold lactonase family protein [Candidatus Polarisedimenticolia bacterium]